MDMKPCFLLAVSVSLLSTAVNAPAQALAKTESKPNILFILADDLGIGDLSCYGSEIKTPNIDSIAKNGLKFEQYYVACSVCTPSRFGMLTGKYPNRSHDKMLSALMFLEEKDDHRGIRADETTIAEVLHTNGYRTAVIGKWHLGHGEPEFFPERHGFDYSYGTLGGCVDYFSHNYGNKPDWTRSDKEITEEGYATDLITGEAVKFLRDQKVEKPFFLFLTYTSPHYGKGVNPQTKRLTNILQAKPEDRARVTNITDSNRLEYAAMVMSMDDGVGTVLKALQEQKLDKNTLIIFASDNGGDPQYGGNNKPFRGGKFNLFEGGIRVPCVMQWIGKIKAASTTKQLASGLDFFPTFCAMVGVSTNAFTLDGMDISSVLFEQKTFARDMFWELPNAAVLRRGDWKYFKNARAEMLFNLATDPAESKNVIAQHPDLVKQLKEAHEAISATFTR